MQPDRLAATFIHRVLFNRTPNAHFVHWLAAALNENAQQLAHSVPRLLYDSMPFNQQGVQLSDYLQRAVA